MDGLLSPENRPIYASARSYEEVRGGLCFPDSYFRPGIRVADIGGGFSGFAKTLAEATGAQVAVIDLMGQDIRDLPDQEQDTLQDFFQAQADRGIFFQGKLPKKGDFDVNLIIAGDVHKLSKVVAPRSFDLIVSYRLGEYIDLGRALPEMVKAITSDGEIRMGGMLLSAVPQESRLYGGAVDYDGSTGEYTFDPQSGFPQTMSWLKNRTDAHAYVAITAPQRRSEVREEFGGSPGTHGYVAGLFIVRLDGQLPGIQKQKSDLEIGSLFEIDPSQVYYDNNRPEFYDKNTYLYCQMKRL